MTPKHVKRTPNFIKECKRLAMIVRTTEVINDVERQRIAQILENNTTDAGCMVKAADDEAIFVLRAHDISAGGDESPSNNLIGTVDHWCELQIAHRLVTNDKRPMTKIADARDCAREMRAYPNRKWPD